MSKIENNYQLQIIKECCANCKYSEDDYRLMYGEQFMCKFCGKVDWNGRCDEWMK